MAFKEYRAFLFACKAVTQGSRTAIEIEYAYAPQPFACTPIIRDRDKSVTIDSRGDVALVEKTTRCNLEVFNWKVSANRPLGRAIRVAQKETGYHRCCRSLGSTSIRKGGFHSKTRPKAYSGHHRDCLNFLNYKTAPGGGSPFVNFINNSKIRPV